MRTKGIIGGIVLGIIAGVMMLSSPPVAYGYDAVFAGSTCTTIRGQSVCTFNYNKYQNVCEMETVDITRIESKLTSNEINLLRQAYSAQSGCGVYPTREVCDYKFLGKFSKTDPYCGDGIRQENEECELGEPHCNTYCKIEIQKPVYYTPMIIEPIKELPVVGGCDLTKISCQIRVRNMKNLFPNKNG